MATKKTAAKKPARKVKKIASKHAASKKTVPMKSFRMYKDEKPFMRVQFTRQTLYWVILLVFVIITQLWILKIQMDIETLTSLVVNQ